MKVGSLTIATFTCNPFSTNSYVVHGTSDAILIDASPFSTQEIERVADYIRSNGLNVVRALLTHGHIDHILGCEALGRLFDVEWEIHSADLPLFQRAPDQAAMFGLTFDGGAMPDETLGAVETIKLEGAVLRVRHTPGHSPGSVSFIDDDNGVAIVGDVLFSGSVGRTDLWEGSFPVLIRSIERELLTLPDDVVVLSGHGPETTIGVERVSNPFLADVSASNPPA